MDKMLFSRHQSLPIYDLYFLRTRPGEVTIPSQPAAFPWIAALTELKVWFSEKNILCTFLLKEPQHQFTYNPYRALTAAEVDMRKSCLCLAVFPAYSYFWHSAFTTHTSSSYNVALILASSGSISPVAVLTCSRLLPSLRLFSLLLFITLCQCHFLHS